MTPAAEEATAPAAEVASGEVETGKPASESTVDEEGSPKEEQAGSGIDAELLALEEELAELEREEQARKETEAAEMLDVSSDDLWQVDTGVEKASPSPGDAAGGIRFAEDIAGFRETDAGRRGGRRGGSSARNRRRR